MEELQSSAHDDNVYAKWLVIRSYGLCLYYRKHRALVKCCVVSCVLSKFPNEYLFMALRILQFGIVFAIGYYLGPASPFAGAAGVPDVPLSIDLKDPEDVTVIRGQSATFRCDATSTTPGVQITWLYNESPIKSNDTKRILQEDGSLYFPKVGGGKKTKGLVGEYRCRAMVQNVSMLSNPAKLKIASFGDFDKQPSNLSVPESQPAVLFCKINSVPAAQIKWEQDYKPLPHNTSFMFSSQI
nr:PREDICTED: protogenin-like [Tribolium castaneum]|eukprot:XP_008198868.2 PREDICTED: protogenin-like [Tribolium castaneum]